MKDEPEYNGIDKCLHKHIDPNFWTMLVVLTVVLVFLGLAITYTNAPDEMVDTGISQRLGDAGRVLITTSQCSYCDAQKDILGSTEGLSVVECDFNEVAAYACAANNVSIVPTWLNVETGEVLEGLQTVEQLELMINE